MAAARIAWALQGLRGLPRPGLGPLTRLEFLVYGLGRLASALWIANS
jgi:hypothetical protein